MCAISSTSFNGYFPINRQIKRRAPRIAAPLITIILFFTVGETIVLLIKLINYAIVKTINTKTAKLVPGVADIYTWEDLPTERYTIAGQTHPEPSPYDRLIIDRHVRFVGDVVAIVAAETEAAASKAAKLIKVEYDILEPVLDFTKALDNPVLVHPEDIWVPTCEVGGDKLRNLVASGTGPHPGRRHTELPVPPVILYAD